MGIGGIQKQLNRDRCIDRYTYVGYIDARNIVNSSAARNKSLNLFRVPQAFGSRVWEKQVRCLCINRQIQQSFMYPLYNQDD